MRPRPDPVGPGQESVWAYPRPAIAEASTVHIVIEHRGVIVADTRASIRTLETSHPPSYYIPPADITPGALRRGSGSSFCEWKGAAIYWDVVIGDVAVPGVGWSYPHPSRGFTLLRDHVAFYAGPFDRCTVNLNSAVHGSIRAGESCILRHMSHDTPLLPVHPGGEQPPIEQETALAPATLDTWAGPVRVEWDSTAPLTPYGQLPFFIEYLKVAGLFDALVADCPLSYTSPNAPEKRDVLGTTMLSVLAGHKRYAHITALRSDGVLPELLGMKKIVSEDAVRRGFKAIAQIEGGEWLQRHLDYCTAIRDDLIGDRTDICADDLSLDLALMLPVHAALDAFAGEGTSFVIEFIELSIEATLQQLRKGGLGGEGDGIERHGPSYPPFPVRILSRLTESLLRSAASE